MWSISRFYEKVYTMAEGGSHYCSKKSDDICGSAGDEVKDLIFFTFCIYPFAYFLITL